MFMFFEINYMLFMILFQSFYRKTDLPNKVYWIPDDHQCIRKLPLASVGISCSSIPR